MCVGLFVLWLISVPFVVANVRDPQLWLMAPWLAPIAIMALLSGLGQVFRGMSWVSRKFHRI